MIIKTLLAILMIGVFFSCNNDEKDCCKIIEATMYFKIENINGEDLLDPDFDYIDINQIKIFYANEDGIKVKVDNSELDASKGYEIVPPVVGNSNFYRIKVHLNTKNIHNNISSTYVEWSSEDMDEIKTEFDLSNNNIIAKKIWVNGELKWESSTGQQLITIIK